MFPIKRVFTFSKCYACRSLHQCVLFRLTISPTCLAADLSVLLASTVWQCLRSSGQPSPANRAFPVLGRRTWNDLPDDVTSAEPLTTFCQRLKAHLLSKSFPWLFPGLNSILFVSSEPSIFYYISHLERPWLIDWLIDWIDWPGQW